MEGLALASWAVYLLVAVAVRALVQWRRTGSTGLRGIGDTAMDRLAGGMFVLGNGLGVAAPFFAASEELWVPGIVLFALGFAGLVAAQYAMGASWRIGVDPAEQTGLVTRGPFAIVRNPIFSAMIPLQLGIVLIAPNVIAAAGWVLVVASIELQVRFVEEPYLARTHGDDYRGYARRVGRFVPGFGRFE